MEKDWEFEWLHAAYPELTYYLVWGSLINMILASFVILWIVDRNVFGLFFYRVVGVLSRSQKQAHRETQEEREQRETRALIKKRSNVQTLKPFRPAPQHENGFNMVLGEMADMETGLSSLDRFYVPEGGVYTNTIAFGSIGSAKTAGFLYPILRQMIAYAPNDREEQIAGLVFDLKGDFAEQVKTYLKDYDREDDFMELTLDGDVVFNLVSDPAMSPQVLASMLQSLVDQVLGQEKAAFWKGQNISLVENMVSAWKCGFDYVNLQWFNIFTLNPERGQALIDYLKGITGPMDEHIGETLIYRNIMPNTETPWMLRTGEGGESEQEHVKLIGSAEVVAKRKDGIENYLDQIQETLPLDEKGVLYEGLKMEDIQTAYRTLYEQEKGLSTPTEIDPDMEARLNRLRPFFEVWKKVYLNPKAPDRADLLFRIMNFFQIPSDTLDLKNPFRKGGDAFAHDFYRYHVDTIHFYKVPTTPLTKALVEDLKLLHLDVTEDRCSRVEYFETWYTNTWLPYGAEMHSKIYGLIGSIVNFFKGQEVKKTFGTSLATYYDHLYNPDRNLRKVFPNFDWLMTEGKWLCVTIPKAKYHTLTDILCNLIKQQFQCVALQRTDLKKRAAFPQYNYDRKVCLMIDEYHIFATSGTTLDCDNNFLSVNRQCRVFFVGATQSMENLKNKFGSEAPVKQILSCVRNKVWLGLEDPDSAKYASELIGEGSVYRVSKSMGENQSDSPYSIFAGDYQGESAGMNQSVSYQQTIDKIVLAKKFLELRSFQAIAVCYDGDQRLISKIYLKPYWRDPDEAFHWQVKNGVLKATRKL